MTKRRFNILLDVLFEHNPYSRTYDKPIRSKLLLSDGDDLLVTVPDKNCILGDKLTAFAPHTTGIPFGKDKELEIIKQMFDCWTLSREMDDFLTVANVYNHVAVIELGYRGMDYPIQEVLLDTIDSCLCIMGRRAIRPDDYQNFISGITSIQGHVFNGRINGENAGMMACEVMYLAACILTEQTEFERVNDPEDYRQVQPAMKGFKKIGYIRHVDPFAYSYLVKSFQLLQKAGYYVDSIMKA
ncbi:MAG: hypothetical protein IKD69_05735 [Solobacterium sp.]|nr:hypothetical protein [Solobacterium sp.]